MPTKSISQRAVNFLHLFITLAMTLSALFNPASLATAAPPEAPLSADFTSCADVTEIPQAECEALVALYNSTDGPNWTNNSGWLDIDTPCDWFGVACGEGHITILSLGDNRLDGNIPAELGALTRLILLFLRDNQLEGNLPVELGALAHLSYLILDFNQLTGNIPSEFGNLTNLQSLHLSNTQMSGEIPVSFTNLVNLVDLSLSCGLISTDPDVIAFIDGILGPGWNVGCPPDATGSISGHIFAADGSTLITDVLISVHAHGISPGSSSLGTYVSQSDGSYTITGLAPGTYKVQANNNREPGYVSKYYDDVFRWENADTIEVVVGQTTSGIDFTLETGGTISGMVLNDQGQVITDVELWVGAGTEDGIWVSTQVSQVDGSYQLSGLPDGEYRVEANFHTLGYDRKYYNNVYRWDMATKVAIAGGNAVTGINFALGPGGGIAGHVYAQDGVTPVEGVCVNVSTTAPDFNQVVGWGTTGPDGSFSFGGVPVGDVYIRTHATCHGGNETYLDEWYADGGSVIDGNQATSVPIVAGQMTENIDFALDQGGSITGHIFDKDGNVITDRLISVHADGISPGTNGRGTYVSQADGSYTISGLAPGDYRVEANNNREPGYVRKFYDNKLGWQMADRVQVAAGQATTGIDFTLEPAGSISGVVYESDGITPIPHIVVSLDGPGFGDGTCTDANGAYTFNSVAYGVDWRVRAAPGGENWCGGSTGYTSEYWQETKNWDAATTLTLSAGTPAYTDINFTLELGGILSGFVYQSDGVTPIPDAWVYAMDTNFQFVAGDHAEADGSYVIGGLPTGNYYIAVQVEGWGGVYYENGYDDPSAVPVAITAPETTANINLLLSPEATISGTVYYPDGVTPFAGAQISVWPKNGGQIREAITDSNGNYVANGLSTGEYVARVIANGYARGYYENAFTWIDATPIQVIQPENTSGIDFTLKLTGNISGYVYQANGVTPIANMALMLESDNTSIHWLICSNTDGQFVFDNIQHTIPWRVVAVPSWRCPGQPEGYTREYWQDTYDWTQATVITLSASQPNYEGIVFNLEQGQTATQEIGTGGGTVQTPEETVTMDIPAGAVSEEITFTITDGGTGYQVATDEGDVQVITSTVIGPPGTTFDLPVTLTFTWPDADNDGIVDGTTITEGSLYLSKDGVILAGPCNTTPGCDLDNNIVSVQVSSLSFFVVGPLAPEPFGKTAPIDSTTNVSLSPTLEWTNQAGATSYEYCYSSAPGPCTRWNSVGTNTSVTLSGLAPNYTYYWQVRAVSEDDTIEANDGTWWSFTTTTDAICTWPAYTPPISATFNDVPMTVGHWNWVERLANSTVTAGCGNGNFCPLTEVNRAQMAIFLLRSKHCGSSYIPPAVGDSTGFGDVSLTASYAAWVKQLAAEGITAGCGNGNFCPQTIVNRAQMAIFLLRAKHGATYSPPAVGASTGFSDVSLDASFAPWVKQLAAEGVTSGCGNGNFCPLTNVNRAQMATFLVRAFGLP